LPASAGRVTVCPARFSARREPSGSATTRRPTSPPTGAQVEVASAVGEGRSRPPAKLLPCGASRRASARKAGRLMRPRSFVAGSYSYQPCASRSSESACQTQ
jgi:hypothetical protein